MTIEKLQEAIDDLQEEKLRLLQLIKASTGFDKSDALDDFLATNREQEDLESLLSELETEDD